MRLHWSPRSPFVRKVMAFAHETGLAPRIETVRSAVEMTRLNAGLMRLNPLNRIPTLIADDGQVLFDSTLICEYLDELHGGARLFPEAPRARWQALRWHALAEGMMEIAVLWRNEVLRPQPSGEYLKAFERKVSACVDFLEQDLDSIGGAKISIAHIAIGCALGYLDFRFPEFRWRDARPKLAAWFAAFSRRASMQETLPKED